MSLEYFIPSKRSWTSGSSPVPLHVLEQAQISTAGMIALLVHFFSRRQATQATQWSERLFGQLVVRLTDALDMDLVHETVAARIPDDVTVNAMECRLQGSEARDPRMCKHLESFLSTSLQCTDAAGVLCAAFRSCEKWPPTCGCGTRLRRHYIARLAEILDANADILGHTNAAAPGTDMRTDGRVTRRLCDERKQALLTMSMQEKKAKSVRALAMARDERGAEHAHRWLREWSLHYSWALRASFEHCTTLSLAFDASRIGCPAEETLTIAAKDCLNGIAGWACPQVYSIAAVLTCLIQPAPHPPPMTPR
eukprot:21710-Amphidinium_carterae.2